MPLTGIPRYLRASRSRSTVIRSNMSVDSHAFSLGHWYSRGESLQTLQESDWASLEHVLSHDVVVSASGK